MGLATFSFALRNPPQLLSAGGELEPLLGFCPHDFLSNSVQFADRVHPEDAGMIAFLFSPECASPAGAVALRMRHADGRIRCFKVRYAREHAHNGPTRLHLYFEDARTISEPGDLTLVASFKSLIEHTNDAIVLKNCNHKILAASRSVSAFIEFVRHPDEIVEKTDYDLHPEAVADVLYRLESRAVAEGGRVNEFQHFRMKNGSERWVDNREYPINGPGGEIIGVLGIAPDITEYLEAVERLRESEASLQQAQRIAGLGSYSWSIPAGTWSCSRVLDEILGLDPSYPHTVEGWRNLIHPDDRAAMTAYLQDEVLGRGSLFNREYRIVRPSDGEERWVHGRGELTFDARRLPVKMHGTIQDVTDARRAQAALRESRELLRLFIKHAPAALAMLDRNLRYLAASARWKQMHSLGDVDLLGRSHYEIFPNLPESWRDEHRRCLNGENIEVSEREFVRPDASVQWIRREVLPWRAADGAIGGIVIFSEDITERRIVEDRLRLSATVFTGAREAIAITDPRGTILDVNDAFTRITGYSRDEAIGSNPRMLKSGLQNDDFYKNMWQCLLRDGAWSGELWNRTKGGDIYAEMLNIHAIRDAAGNVKQYVGLATDITQAKEHEQQLELVTHYDALTGLPNRALLVERMRQAMAQASRLGLLVGIVFFDLDSFKAINDVYGHPSGDALLAALAARMKHALRDGDTLARLGGDEFAAILPDLPHRDACLPVLTAILDAAAHQVQVGEVLLHVTASAGVAFYPQDEDLDADLLLRQAGQALYEAKLAGKNRYYFFDPNHDLLTRSRHENIEHLRHALAAHELVLHYQPKVNMRTGEVIGAEALLRWQHPERGLLPPGLFLPVIEDHPLSISIGEWVIESALAQMEYWHAAGFILPVSVNVSAYELQEGDFVQRLRARLAAHPRVNPAHLELEVLETSALQNVVLSSQILAACRDLGVVISIDDFGTGYSSLTYLKRLPANALKIDQSFVRDMLDEPESLTILKGVLGLAEAFRRQVIAEGVETADHGLMLLQLGCDQAQGYGIAKPMPASELPAWAAAWRPDVSWIGVPRVHADNREVLFAIAEHRAWFGHLMSYLQGARPSPPNLDIEPCNLTAWLDTQKIASGMSPTVLAAETIHEQLHALAAEIVATHSSGYRNDGLALLRQLRYLNERCLKRLDPFTRVSNRRSARSLSTGPVTISSDSSLA